MYNLYSNYNTEIISSEMQSHLAEIQATGCYGSDFTASTC